MGLDMIGKCMLNYFKPEFDYFKSIGIFNLLFAQKGQYNSSTLSDHWMELNLFSIANKLD